MSSTEDHDCDSDERVDTSGDTSGHDSSQHMTNWMKRLKINEDMDSLAKKKKRTSLQAYNGVNDLALEVLKSSESYESKVESIEKHLNFMKELFISSDKKCEELESVCEELKSVNDMAEP